MSVINNYKPKMAYKCEHTDRSLFARGKCRSCYEKWLRKNNPEYAERQRKNHRDWYNKYKERARKYTRDWQKYKVKKDPNYNKIRNLKRYGLTLDDYFEILKRQNGGCAICNRKPANNRNLSVDHDHDTGKVRGLLCFRCNFGMSYFSEDPQMMWNAFTYLIKSQKIKEKEKNE